MLLAYLTGQMSTWPSTTGLSLTMAKTYLLRKKTLSETSWPLKKSGAALFDWPDAMALLLLYLIVESILSSRVADSPPADTISFNFLQKYCFLFKDYVCEM